MLDTDCPEEVLARECTPDKDLHLGAPHEETKDLDEINIRDLHLHYGGQETVFHLVAVVTVVRLLGNVDVDQAVHLKDGEDLDHLLDV